jgi:MraZ protein
MFLGRFERTIDGKGRLTIPSKYRADLGDRLVITRGEDRCLVVFPLSTWEERSEKISRLATTKSKVRNYRRRFFSEAHDGEPDDQGRILIPPHLREYARLDGGVVVTGLNDYLEVWNPTLWEAESAKFDLEDVDPDEWIDIAV